MLTALDYLETILPKGSHVSTYGLADGQLLYEIMHNRLHPLGNNFPEITYTRVYDYLNCLHVSPCWVWWRELFGVFCSERAFLQGWMNSNATVRNYTTTYANMLSGIYQDIINEYGNGTRWTNFDIHYWNMDFEKIIQMWQQQGGQPWQLIEPIDGFVRRGNVGSSFLYLVFSIPLKLA